MVAVQRRFPFELFAVIGLIYGVGIFISRALPGLDNAALLATALTADLTLLVPALYYWLAVRRQKWPAASTIPVFLACIFAASKIIPTEHQGLLQDLHLVVPAVEVTLLVALGFAVRRALGQARAVTNAASSGSGDVLETASEIVERVTGNRRVADAMAYELGLISYAFTLQRPPEDAPEAFSYHRRTALSAITAVLLLIIAVETVPVHLLLSLWSPVAAWIVTALTIYSAVWLVGDARAMRRRPIQVNPDALRLRFGLRWSLEIPWADIEELGPFQGRKTPPSEGSTKERLELVPMGASPTHRLQLRHPLNALGPYGLRRNIREVAFFVDEPQRFDEASQAFLEKI